MFSQWATKRVCKFFMKRLLGRMLRSELDLEQLEVQLGSGTIQLKDLSLNTDFLNDQLGDASVVFKDGTIGSVRAKIPWKVLTAESCEIEVDELELVVIPRAPCNSCGNDVLASSAINEGRCTDASNLFGGEAEASALGSGASGAYLGVDDGVRMIAKMVERVLLGLRVKVTNILIFFEDQPIKIIGVPEGERSPGQRLLPGHSSLVIRVPYMEYGVDAPLIAVEESLRKTNGAEPTMLVKVVKFRGATIELFNVMDEETSDMPVGDMLAGETDVGDFQGRSVPVLVGVNGGVSGSIQLSMPWKDGCIDVPKVNADFDVSPVTLKLSSVQIQQLLGLSQAFNLGGNVENANGSSVTPKAPSHSIGNAGDFSGSRGSMVMPLDWKREGLLTTLGQSSNGGVRIVEGDSSGVTFLPVTRFISDWMHWAGNDGQRKDGAVAEADLAASVDEFFECFDGTRSSQAGSSSMCLWNWTRSAFTAITTASSLAAGSVVIPPDPQKQVEYSIKARLGHVCLELVYESTIVQQFSVPTVANEWGFLKESSLPRKLQPSLCMEDKGVEYLQADLSELVLSVMVSGCQTEVNVTITSLSVSEVVTQQVIHDVGTAIRHNSHEDFENRIFTESLQLLIEDCLPPFPASLGPCKSCRRPRAISSSKETGSVDDQNTVLPTCGHHRNVRMPQGCEQRQLLWIISDGEYAARFTLKWQAPPFPSDASVGRMNMVVFLQPIIVWLNVLTLKRIEYLLVRSYSTDCGVRLDPSSVCDMKGNPRHRVYAAQIAGSSVKENVLKTDPLHISLFAPCARMIFCFPVDSSLICTELQKNFLALDLTTIPSKLGNVQPIMAYKHAGNPKTGSNTPTNDSFMLSFGDVAVNLISASGGGNSSLEGLSFHGDVILNISQQSLKPSPFPEIQPDKGASLELQWNGGVDFGSWVAKRAWDVTSAQRRQGDGGSGIGGSNSEFAAATMAAEAVEEENRQLRRELVSCSSSVLHVNVPQLQCRVSESQYTCVLELVACFTEALQCKVSKDGSQGNTQNGGNSEHGFFEAGASHSINLSLVTQVAVLVKCNHVDVDLHLNRKDIAPATVMHSSKAWDLIHFEFDKVQVLSVSNIGGSSDSSYLWVNHEDAKVTGSFLNTLAIPLSQEPKLLLSCSSDALGRGDGGGGNALAAGTAGMTLTYMIWPGRDQLADVLLTGTMRGCSFVAHGGCFDWLSAVVSFFNVNDQSLSLEGTVEAKSSDEDSSRCKSKLDSTEASSCSPSTFFLLDLHDVALCYEPGPEALLAAVDCTSEQVTSKVGESSVKPSASETIQPSPVACVLAAAAVQVSNRAIPNRTGEQYDIWLRDAALLLLDTFLRKNTSLEYTTDSMHRTGYVQVLKEAVMEAALRIDSEDGLQWELECANNQLRFDTCHDTTAAFGRLVTQLQQLFAPELDNSNLTVTAMKGDGRNTSASDLKNLGKDDSQNYVAGDTGKEKLIATNLFEGVLEDAFSRVRNSWSSTVGEDDDLSSGSYTMVSEPPHSRVSSLDWHEFLDRRKPNLQGLFTRENTASLSHDVRTSALPPSEDGQSGNTGLPAFIEDYYVASDKHTTHSRGVFFARQSDGLARQSKVVLQKTSKESVGPGSGREGEGKGGWYGGKSMEVLENHVPDVRDKVQSAGMALKNWESQGKIRGKITLPKKYPLSVGRVILRDLSARWRFYGGSDWQITARSQEQGATAQKSLSDSGRQTQVCLEVMVDGMDLQYDAFPPIGLYASRLAVSIRDIGVYDCSSDAPWTFVLGYHRSKSRPRESTSQAVKIEMDSVRPDPLGPREEYRLSLVLLPIRLHVDQRHIDFCIDFFSPRTSSPSANNAADGTFSQPTSAVSNDQEKSETSHMLEETLLPFFQICEMRPLMIRVDYVPRRVDLMSLRGGNYAELLNLVSWKGIELNLKHVKATGVYGWSSLAGVVFGEWLEDISQNQVHKFVRGVGPIRPLYAMGSGAAKLVVLPAEHYRKDRRLLRGMQKGAVAFLRSISLEALGLGAHLASGAHEILLQTEVALGGSPLPFVSEQGERCTKSLQPCDTREGLQQAYESISRGLERTASSLVGNPLKAYQRGAGAGLAVGSALRAAPAAAVAPASAAAGAVHRALLGVRNGLDPEHKRESDEKHSGPQSDSRRIQR